MKLTATLITGFICLLLSPSCSDPFPDFGKMRDIDTLCRQSNTDEISCNYFEMSIRSLSAGPGNGKVKYRLESLYQGKKVSMDMIVYPDLKKIKLKSTGQETELLLQALSNEYGIQLPVGSVKESLSFDSIALNYTGSTNAPEEMEITMALPDIKTTDTVYLKLVLNMAKFGFEFEESVPGRVIPALIFQFFETETASE